MLSKATLKTPVGSLYLISHEHLLLASGFSNFRDLTNQLDEEDRDQGISEVKRLPIISDLLDDYFSGDLKALDGISVRQPGEKFSQSAWKAMRKVSPGKTISYGELAKRAGSADAVRAAGSACARNLIALVVPCHRIVKTGGALGNYAYGLPVKEWLLRHEGALK
ncbi:MAG: methylated-DNA--[protein]-cysteine S-methyltransferase [Candidatus Nanopelagicaceae bacterium]|jgi:methylated-DNA-[protein]-cysteine S-methyltransferase|nr:methylated-DNA--[protein]-cysteine S-methyltransferase [Actinomycetota bacterium]NCV43668.1 methylated-DNA--[protein]-cysteine S-methyltransferase [Actinomycetota bacterium]NCV83152.1 methylated-DNA--[protein]-cysteine S-methyltransferase [Actinomycetota bacterium]NCV95631.1 methylated-DNA--[protein]-cysteine S-methyltransferase [Actinomycetota bacterium]NCW46752.1 methylated-DNA--[protein]-cysteine S-methyltransferase [Actinomycetota bacterium]